MLWRTLVALIAAFCGLPAGLRPASALEWPVTVATVAGATELVRRGSTAWTGAELNDTLGEGDAIRTSSSGRATLKTAGGDSFRLGPGTRLILLDDSSAEDGRVARVRLTGGWVWVAALPTPGSRPRVGVQAGPVVVRVARGGASIRVNRDGSVLVQVRHGAVVCEGAADRGRWQWPLSGGQEILVGAGGGAGPARPLVEEPTEAAWVRWNADQDRAGGYAIDQQAR